MADINNGGKPTIPIKTCSDISPEDPSPIPKKQKPNPHNETTNNDQTTPEPPLEDQNKQTPHDQIEETDQKPAIDRKGKGILIEEDDSDDSDDGSDDDSDDSDEDISGDEGGDVDGDEFVDDPLGEVNLDNILPSRTRRRSVQPGAYIATDLPYDDDSDDSDDPDA